MCEVLEDKPSEIEKIVIDDPEALLFEEGSVITLEAGHIMFLSKLIPLYSSIIHTFLNLSGVHKLGTSRSIGQNIGLVFPTMAILTAQVIEAIGDLPLFLSEYEVKRLMSNSVSSKLFVAYNNFYNNKMPYKL